MYLSQVFETGLINILTALETAKSAVPTRATFDALYAQHESLTFGNLMKRLGAHRVLPVDLADEVNKLKSERDWLAHRFFREHDLDFMSMAGCHVMIEKLTVQRDRFLSLDKRISALQAQAFGRIGIDPGKFDAMAEAEMRNMLEEARARYSSTLRHAETT